MVGTEDEVFTAVHRYLLAQGVYSSKGSETVDVDETMRKLFEVDQIPVRFELMRRVMRKRLKKICDASYFEEMALLLTKDISEGVFAFAEKWKFWSSNPLPRLSVYFHGRDLAVSTEDEMDVSVWFPNLPGRRLVALNSEMAAEFGKPFCRLKYAMMRLQNPFRVRVLLVRLE